MKTTSDRISLPRLFLQFLLSFLFLMVTFSPGLAAPTSWSSSFVIGMPYDSWIYYAKNNGDGTFGSSKTVGYLGENYACGVIIEDFNGDGHLDFIAGRGYSTAYFYLFLNDGADNFTNVGLVGTLPNGYAMDMAAGDFNNDGLVDFIANTNSSTSGIFLNDGRGGFTRTEFSVPNGQYGRGIDAADFNGDGNLDFAMSVYSNGDVHVFLGNGDGTFTSSLIGTASNDNYAVAAADFDNDGKVDIIVSGSSNGDTFFYKGNGDGTFQAPLSVPTLDINNHSGMDGGDLNGDGKADIVLSEYGWPYRLWFYPGNGDGTFGTRTQIPGNGQFGISTQPTLSPAGFPVAVAAPKSQTILVDGTANLSGTSSSDSDGTISTYAWKFGDSFSGTGATISHAYHSEGIFAAALTVTDNDGKKNTDVARVKVLGAVPVASAGGPYSVGETAASNGRYPVTLDGSASTDDSGIVNYEWDMGETISKNFDDGNLDGWTSLGGTWGVDAGSYRQSDVSVQRQPSLIGNIKSGDYTVEADAMILAGSGRELMLVFRALDQNNRYEMIFRPRDNNNDVLLYRWINGGPAQIGYTRLPFVPQDNTWYRLKVEAYGSNIKCYVNGSLMMEVSDSSLPNGKVGLATYYVDARFDNFTVYSHKNGVNPTHSYPEGTYTATLTVTDKAGQKATASAPVVASKGTPPVAVPGGPYTFDETFASQGSWTVTLNGAGSTDDFGIEQYLWNFGDGSSGTGATPTHTYVTPGTYTVTLTVIDRAGQINTATTSVTIKGDGFPVAIPGGPYTVPETAVVNRHWDISVDASASTDDRGIWKYSWNFGDGVTADTKTASHTYAYPATYEISLTVTDHANQSHTTKTSATVTGGAPPTAKAGGPYAGEPGTPIAFDGLGSTDDAGILSYGWNFGDGTTGKGARPTHSYTSPGTYTATLTVTDLALQTASETATVIIAVGSAPVADAGGPYSTSVDLPLRLNASGSHDDVGIASYRWVVGTANSLFQDSFTGAVIDETKWDHSSAGTTQNDVLSLDGFVYSWGSRYIFSKDTFAGSAGTVLRAQINQTAGGHLMFGFKDSGINFSYEVMPYAFYFQNGIFMVYESGNNRGSFGYYSFGTTYDVKIELKTTGTGTLGGARYYVKPAAAADWTLLYDSNYEPGISSYKVGASQYSGTFTLDNFSLVSGIQELSGVRPVMVFTEAGVLPVQLTVTDGAGQTAIATTTITVSQDPVVITAPWQFSGGAEVPHDTWSGEEVILKAVVKSRRGPLTYIWDFGDGTTATSTTVSNKYDVSARHIYTADPGTPFTARVTVTDADGKSSSDTFPVIVRPKTLDVETNKAIDDALWYIHTQQNRSNGSWQSSGYTTGYYSSPTASAIHAMEINGHLEVGDIKNDPYVEDVMHGMRYLLTTLNSTAIDNQSYGDPDVNSNGTGIQVSSDRPVYEGGQVMMALVASGTPNAAASTGGAGIIGKTYREIVEDMAEMYYWGQGDDAGGYGAGGWRYGWQGQGDNSASQWAALGMTAAEEQGWLSVPKWVKDRNLVWLTYSSDGTGYGYTGPGNDIATTPSAMAQLAFVGVPTSDSRWKTTENFLASYWNNWYNGSGNYYSLYALAKAMRTAKPSEVVIMGEGTANAIDWYNDATRGMARIIVSQKDANGMFTGGGGGTHWVEGAFRNAWGVIILTKTLFVLPPVAVAGENKVWGVDVPLTFNGARSYHLDPARKIAKYEWDFDGDGVFDSTSVLPTVTHTYALADYPKDTLPRTFSVTLRVTDDNDPSKYDTDTLTILIAEPPHPPVAVPGGPYTGFAGIPLQLDGSASFDIDPSDYITSYGWELDGVSPYNFADATGVKPTYTWNTPGSYNIGLRVFDNGVMSPDSQKLSDTQWTTVTIKPNNPPVAKAGGPYTVNEGENVTLDGTGSSDPDGNVITYAWDLDNNGTYETAGATVVFSWPNNGSFTVGLKVTDGALESTDTAVVTVNNVAPSVNVGLDATINEGGTFTGIGSFTDPGADTWSATVNYGDGSAVQTLTLSGKNFTLSHVYPQNGTFTVTVAVTDSNSGVGSDTAIVTVNNVVPVVNAGLDVAINEGGTFSRSGSFTDPGTDTWSATVNYGDGSGVQSLTLSGKTFTLSHVYPQNGTFTVTVTVTDSNSGVGSDTAIVTVNNVVPVVNAGLDATINEGGTFSGSGSFTDSGADTWSATVNYGDGSGVQSLTLSGKTFTLSHVYPQNGTFTVTVTVTDSNSGVGSDTAIVTVNNVVPVVNAGPDATINEGGTFTGSGSFTDPGADTWSATVNYGDGSAVQSLTLSGKTFTLSHVYPQNGTFTVTVTVTDSNSGVGSDTAIVTVNNVVPVVNAGPDATINEGGTFTGSGSFTDPGADTWSATVNYGDGSAVQTLILSGKTFTLSHVYPQNGAFTVTVTVTDSNSGVGSDTAIVTVNNVVPVVNAGLDATINEGGTFTGSGSFTDPGADTWSATVNYGDGSAVQTLTLSGKNFTLSHVYPQNGTFTVTVTVTDSNSGVGSDTAIVTVNNIVPVVNGGLDATINEGGTFTGSGSFTDPGADTWSATVNYGDGSAVQTLTLSGKTFTLSHVYPQNGTFTVTVTVTDSNSGVGSDTAIVTVNNVVPVVNAGLDATINEGGTFSSSGTFIDPGADTWSATVNYGDGSAVQTLILSGKNFTLSHVYPQNGAFTVTVTVTDSNSGVGSDTAIVTVNNVVPVVNAGLDATINEGGTFSSSGTFIDPGADTWSATVNYGDGSAVQTLILSGKNFTLSHVYPQNGAFTVTVTVTDSNSGVGSDTAIVTVNNVVPVVNAGLDATINEGGTFSSSGTFTDPGADTWSATVNYGDGSGVQTLILSGKTFTLSHVYAQKGSYTVTVTVNDSNSGIGSDTAVVTVKAMTITVVNSSSNPSIPGQSVTFTATLSPLSATGTVTFKDGTTVLGTGTLSGGSASFSTTTLTVGTHSITAVFSGDGSNNGSTSTPVSQLVAPLVLIDGTTQYFTLLRPAYDSAISGATIKALINNSNENLLLSTVGKAITIKGGYDPTYTTQSGYSTVKTLTISNGKVVVNRLIIR
ncbi:MAG: PKD domain-containing protein [Desulfuromonadaceae bacterium]